MRNYPTDADDRKDMARLNAEPWMVEALKLNPSYVYWGPHEDYMCKTGEGWDSRVVKDRWTEFGPWKLDELNEVVNFYFHVERASEPCAACDQGGYNPATKRISDDFYDFAGTGRRWVDAITQDEADALREAGRLRRWKDGAWRDEPVTAEEVNAANRPGSRSFLGGLSHDAINRGILIETRAKRLKVYGLCAKCDGHGYVFTAPAATLSLTLWFLHPRKGCSRGVEVKSLTPSDLKAACAWLKTAAERNAERFAKVVVAANEARP